MTLQQILLLLLYIKSVCGTSDLTCPSQTEVGSKAAITCIAPDTTDKHGYSTPNKEVAAICQLKVSSCQTLGHYSAAVVIDTSSVLTIPRVRISDAGDLRCAVPPSPVLTCRMVVYRLPSCVVIRNQVDQATKENLTGYFCSEDLHFQVVGSVCKCLTKPVTRITDGSFNCTAAQLGSADTTSVTFTCGKVARSLKCEEDTWTGVRQDTTAPSTRNKERPRHTSTGIALPVIICIIILIIIIITMAVLYRNRHDFQCLFKQSTQSDGDSGYKFVEKSEPVSL